MQTYKKYSILYSTLQALAELSFGRNRVSVGKAKIKSQFVSRSTRAFNIFAKITTFIIFIWTLSKIKIKLPILR